MERFWRGAGVALGKYWIVVMGAVVLITVVLAPGLGKLEFATGQDSYLNSDSQIAIDNEFFQSQYGGEVAVVLFQSTDGTTDVTTLIDGANGEELARIEEEIRSSLGTEADGGSGLVLSTILPYTATVFAENILVSGTGTDALLGASLRDEAGGDTRQEDLAVTLARLNAIEPDDRDFSNPDWVDFLIFGNDGYAVVDEVPVAPPDDDRIVRASLRSTYPGEPGADGYVPQGVAVGGVVLKGNASLDEQSEATDEILEIMATADLDGWEVITTGSPVYLKEINDYLQGGMLQLGAAAVGVMALVLLFLFRVRWRLLPLVVVLIGVLWGFSLLGYIGIELSLVTISGLPILIGLGIDFAIQIHNRVEEEVVLDKEEHPIAESLANVGPALIVATIAAVLAFLALRVSQVPMIRSFGVMLIVGIVVLVIVGIALPASWLGIREWKGRTQERGESKVEKVVVWFGSLPSSAGIPLIVASVALFVGGILLEGQFTIESDPIRWIDQESEAVADVETLTDETGFETTLGILVQANNVFDQDVVDLMHEFTSAAEDRDGGEVVTASSLTNTLAKIIEVPGTDQIAPASEDLVAALEAAPPDIERVLVSEDLTSAQINFRLAPADLAERAVLIEELETDLDARIDALDDELDAESVLLLELEEDDPVIRAVPSGLAVVGVGLLDNLKANRAVLTYLGLALVALWLLVRTRSITRALLSLTPVGLAIGASSVVIALLGVDLSPLTTVSGPLVIATCTEFSVLILSRFIEERKTLDARAASNHAAARTGRAFFTSAATTIGGFLVLLISPLPLLRDFGLIVSLNVAVALLSALVVMPPLMVWADNRGLLPAVARTGSVRLAAGYEPRRFALTAVAVVVVGLSAFGLYASADTESGEDVAAAGYVAVALPEPEPPPTTEAVELETELIDLSQFGTDKPDGLVGGLVFDLLVAQGADPQQAVCTAVTLLERVPEAEILALGAEALDDPRVRQTALDCAIAEEIIEATIEAGLTG